MVRLAVLSAEDWEALIEWLETLEDVRVARKAFAELKAAKGNRRRAGWLEWDAVKGELENEKAVRGDDRIHGPERKGRKIGDDPVYEVLPAHLEVLTARGFTYELVAARPRRAGKRRHGTAD